MADGGDRAPPADQASIQAAAGWTQAPGTTPQQNMWVPQASWDTSAWGNYDTPKVDPVTGTVSFPWKSGSQSFAADPSIYNVRSASGNPLANWLFWPGSSNNVPVLGAGQGGASNVITDPTDIASSPFWGKTGSGTYAPTQEGWNWARQQQAAYDAGNSIMGALQFVLPVGLGAAGLLAGPALGGIASSLLGSSPTIAGTDLTTAALSGQLGAGATGGLGTISSAAPSLLGQAWNAYQTVKPYVSGVQNVMKIAQGINSIVNPPLPSQPTAQSASLLR